MSYDLSMDNWYALLDRACEKPNQRHPMIISIERWAWLQKVNEAIRRDEEEP